jgi:drug/metabolite transporter (DMT)-like permease
MPEPEFSTIAFGFASAASWGAGDFCGGLATKRSNVYSVVILSQFIGAILLVILAILFAEKIPSIEDLILGGMAGLSGAVGLVALYRGLAGSQMGTVAPVAAVVSTGVPVTFGVFLEGLPASQQLGGFALAFIGVWFISRNGGGFQFQTNDLWLPVLAGLAFGVFFILIDRVSETTIFWPLVAARITSLTMLLLVASRKNVKVLPKFNELPIITFSGVFDSGGNAFFALAAQSGRLDIAAVLSSFYAAFTVIFAWIILKEKLERLQWIGVAAALGAVVLIGL